MRSCGSRRRLFSCARPPPGSPGPGRRSSCPRRCPPRPQVAGPLDRSRDRLGHLDLLGAMLVGWQSSRNGAAGAKDRNRVQICHVRSHRAKRKSAFPSNQSESYHVPTQWGVSYPLILPREDATPMRAQWKVLSFTPLWRSSWFQCGPGPNRRCSGDSTDGEHETRCHIRIAQEWH